MLYNNVTFPKESNFIDTVFYVLDYYFYIIQIFECSFFDVCFIKFGIKKEKFIKLCFQKTIKFKLIDKQTINKQKYQPFFQLQNDKVIIKNSRYMQILATKSRGNYLNNNLTTTQNVSNVLKALNRNTNWKNSSMKFNKTINTKNLTQKSNIQKNLMTQQDLDKLFLKSKQKTKTQTTNILTESWSYKSKDLVNSVKFLRLDDQYDKLLTGIPPASLDQYSKIQQLFYDNSKDLTTQFKQNYLVGKIVGQGAYASVRVAIYKPMNKKIAIKVYQKNKIKQPQKKKSVRREIKILQNLNHPNILKILDVVQTNNHLNIIMEYLPGISLSNFIKAQPNNRTPQKTCKKIVKCLAQALRYMHNKNIAHRDIKLQNVILDQDVSPKLIDFGFSTCLESHQKVKIFCGTPSYMAPQIVQKRQYKGQPADIWALGVLFFVTLTGIFPFKGATDQQLYKKINSADYPRSQIAFSKQITDLINKMLRINPDQRITASQILNHPWIKQRSIFKKTKKTQSSIQARKKTGVSSIHKSKQKQFNNTRKLTQTCKQNLKLELKLIKRSSQSKKFNKTCTQRNIIKQIQKSKLPQKYDKKTTTSSSQNKQNTAYNLSSTNKKVLDLLKNQLIKKSSQSKPKTRRA